MKVQKQNFIDLLVEKYCLEDYKYIYIYIYFLPIYINRQIDNKKNTMSSGSINIDPYEIDERQFPILGDSHSLSGNHSNSPRYRGGNQSIRRVRPNTRRQRFNVRIYRLLPEQQGAPDVSNVIVNGRHISIVIKPPVPPTRTQLDNSGRRQSQSSRFQTIRVEIVLPSNLTDQVTATVSSIGIDDGSNNQHNVQLIVVDRILSNNPFSREDINVIYDSSDESSFGPELD